jgi:hydrogenase expression/formation protein HypE
VSAAGAKAVNRAAASPGATITMAHGGGGRAMRGLIERVFLPAFDNPWLATLEDQARIPLAELAARGDRLVFTTDTYVVTPLEFPGGDIGKLAVYGTVNDLAVSGAEPLFLSCGMVLEEGLPMAELSNIAHSMGGAARTARIAIVTGDTKVVERGAAMWSSSTDASAITASPFSLHAMNWHSLRPWSATVSRCTA